MSAGRHSGVSQRLGVTGNKQLPEKCKEMRPYSSLLSGKGRAAVHTVREQMGSWTSVPQSGVTVLGGW